MKGSSHIAAFAALAVLLVAGIYMATDSGDAADATVDNIKITIFTADSENYYTLAYQEDTIPDAVDVPSIVRDGGLWYKVDRNSAVNGMYMTYGDLIPAIPVSDIRADLTARYGTDFTLVQVSFRISAACNISYNILKDGASQYSQNFAGSTVIGGYDCTSYTYVKVLAVGTDFTPAKIAGTYTLNVKCNGILVGSSNQTVTDKNVSVIGRIVDQSNRPVPYATVYYAMGDGTSSKVNCNANGEYTIPAPKGTYVRITQVERNNYTFGSISVNSGTISGDKVLPDIKSNEMSVPVRIKDVTGTKPVTGVLIEAKWYVQKIDPVSNKNILTKREASSGQYYTDSDGIAYLVCKRPTDVPASDYALYITATDGNFSFECDYPPETEKPAFERFNFTPRDLPGSIISAMGNDFAVLANASSPSYFVELRAQEAFITVSVNGAKVGSVATAPITGVQLEAKWYYQTQNTLSDYSYRTDMPLDFGMVSNGVAFAVGQTDESGHALVAYKVPVWSSSDPKFSAFLYVGYISGGSVFSFNVPINLVGASVPIDEYMDDYPGASVLPSTAVADMGILSEDIAYTVSGTITGPEMPSMISATYNLYGSTMDSLANGKATVTISGTTATFVYTVRAGLSSKIDLASADSGYTFGEQSRYMENSNSNLVFETTITKNAVTPYARTAPIVVKTSTVSGLDVGDTINLSCSVSGKNYLFARTVDSGTALEFSILGFTDYLASNPSVTGSESLYFPAFDGDSLTAARNVVKSLVAFAEQGATEPTIHNIVKAVKIRVYFDTVMTEVTTTSEGVANFTVPEGYPLTYFYYSGTGEFPIGSPTVISGGPFDGKVSIDLSEYIDAEVITTIHITEQAVSYSSLYNTAPATITVLREEVKEHVTGTTVKFQAPSLSGFAFSGWYFGDECLSELSSFNLDIVNEHDGKTITAVYSPLPAKEPEKGIDSMTLMIGMVAIMIAIMCFAYVLLMNRGY